MIDIQDASIQANQTTTTPPTLLWNEQRAAALLAFEEEETHTPASILESTEPTLSPRDQTVTPSLGKSPLAKVGVVGMASLGVFAIAGLIITSLGRVNVSPAMTQTAQVTDGSLPLDTVLELSQSDQEKANLLTEAALGKQEAQLAALKPSQKSKLQPTQPPVVLPKVTGQPAAIPPPPTLLPAPPPLPAPIPAVAQPIDPAQQWLAASTTGSYGQVMVPPPPPSPAPVATDLPAVNPAEEAAILTNQSVRQLVIGTQTPAKLLTPILQEATLPSEPAAAKMSWRFTVRLEAPLSTGTGDVVFPVGTELTAEVTSLGESGLLSATVVAAVVEGQEHKLPSQALTIRGAEGQPLLARKYHDPGGDMAGMDAALVMLGGLAKVGELVNRPQSTASLTTGLGGLSTVAQNPPPNLVAAAMEGGFSSLSKQVSDRNQKALQEALTRANLWFVEPGVPVQVFVNQTIQL